MKKILLLATVLLMAVAGCSLPFDSGQTDTSEQKPIVTEQDPPATWTLSVRILEGDLEQGERIQIKYAGNRDFRGTAYGIKLLFLNEDKEVIKEIPVENLTTERYSNTVNTTVPELPVYMTAKMNGEDSIGRGLVAIKGYYITADGVEPYFVTNESEFFYNGSSG